MNEEKEFIFQNIYIEAEVIKFCEHWCIVKRCAKLCFFRHRLEMKMAEEEKRFSRQLLGKTVVSKTGKRFGEVGDMVFETRSGELIHLVLANPTAYTEKLELEKDREGNILIPFSAVIAIGDFLVIAEEDII